MSRAFALLCVLVLLSVSLASATTFRSAQFYSDDQCSQLYDPTPNGATTSYSQWTSLPATTITNATTSKCVTGPLAGNTAIGSATYVCQQAIDSVSGARLQWVFIHEYVNTNCNDTAVNFYSMAANVSDHTATFPLCLQARWFNSRNYSDFFAKIDCANTNTTYLITSNSVEGGGNGMILSGTVDTDSSGASAAQGSLAAVVAVLLVSFLAIIL